MTVCDHDLRRWARLALAHVLVLALGASGCASSGGGGGGEDAGRPPGDAGGSTAALRVVHLSPDAPNIDAFVDGEGPVASNLAFTNGTPTLDVEPGRSDVQIAATGSPASDAVVSIDDLLLEAGKRYTAFAFNPLSDVAVSSVEDSAQGLASNRVRVRVVHAADGVGTVDVYDVTDGGTAPLAQNLRFGTAAAPVDLPTDSFVAGIDVDGDGVSDLKYDVPALEAGTVVNVFAVADSDGTVFLLAQLPGEQTVRLDAVQQRLRVVHLSPDAPPVRPLLGGEQPEGFGQVTFPGSTDYAAVAASTQTLDVTTDGTPETSVLSAELTLEGGSYTAVALDRLADIRALAFEDDRSGLAAGDVRVRAIHGAPDVGEVDLLSVDEDGTTAPLVSDVSFGDAAPPLDLPAGAYTIGVDTTDDGQADLFFELPELEAGTLANVYVTQDDEGDVFALAQLDGDATLRVDPASSEVRVLHLSRDAPDVDVYVGGERVVTGLAFKDQSGSLDVASGTYDVAVTASGAPVSTAVIETTVTVLPGEDYVVVAYDDLVDIKGLVLQDDPSGLAGSDVRVPITHVAPGVTRGDVFETPDGDTFGVQLVDDFGFGETQIPPDLTAGRYTVGFDAEANGTLDVLFELPALTPGTYARAYVYQEADEPGGGGGEVGVLLQLEDSTQTVLGM